MSSAGRGGLSMAILVFLLLLKCACVAGEDKFQMEIDAMKKEVNDLKVKKEKKAAAAQHSSARDGGGCGGAGSQHCMSFASWSRVAMRRDPTGSYVSYLRQQAKRHWTMNLSCSSSRSGEC